MQINRWLSYGELAWTESIIAPPENYVDETSLYVRLIKENSDSSVSSLFHLACGAGGNDYTFKEHFEVTGVDISEEMLKIARVTNPEVTYLHGDMRTVDLNKQFDAVVIPDSIDYMETLPELKKAISTANRHLKPGGVLLIVTKTREEFSNNNFCYTGSKDDVEITIFENNYISSLDHSTYEATIVYLIRQQGKLSTYIDCHQLGLFTQQQWLSLFRDEGLQIKQQRLDDLYDQYLLNGDEYPMTIFIANKLQ